MSCVRQKSVGCDHLIGDERNKKEIAVQNSSASNADNFQNAAFHMRETQMSAHTYPKAELQHLHLFPVLSSHWGLKINESLHCTSEVSAFH
ncbi:hypothetical protein DV515_00006060, partial [Chloebia gouldiae]